MVLSNPAHISKVKFLQSLAAGTVSAGLVLGHFPALMSVGAVLLFLSGVLLNTRKDWKSYILIAFFLYWLWQVLSYFWCDDIHEWQQEIVRKISLILIPAGLLVCSIRLVKVVLISFCLSVLLVALLSVGNYFLHYDEINLQISKSIGMPIASKLSHIYFSIFNGLAVLLCLYLWKITQKKNRWWLVASGILLICLHILSSRTGLVAFYITTGLLLIQLIYLQKKWKTAIAIGLTACILPIGIYYTSASFKNRIDNTVEDLDHYFNGKYLNYYSISMRFEAWKVCWNIWEENPIIGVGVGDLPQAMKEKYDAKKITEEVRIQEAHNQYLEQLASLGIIGLISLLYIFYVMIRRQGTSFFAISVLGIFAASMLFESVAESHNGIAAFALFATLVATYKK